MTYLPPSPEHRTHRRCRGLGAFSAFVVVHLGLLYGCRVDGASSAQWQAPLLLGIRDLTTVVRVVDTLTFGVSREGTIEAGAPIDAYLVDAEGGAELTFDATPAGELPLSSALAVYGPRTPEGLFGVPLAQTPGDGRGGAHVTWTTTARGVYLVVVGRATPRGGSYLLALRCTGACGAPACRSPVCARSCAGGFRRDAQGCERCECATSAAPLCLQDATCGPGRACRDGACVSACSCTEAYAPVCGVNGRTFASACEARCAGEPIATVGECAALGCGAGPPCGPGARCSDGACAKFASLVPVSCPDTYAPVCGVDGQTYGNECLLEAGGVGLRGRGPCVRSESGCLASCIVDADCGSGGVACHNGFCQPEGCSADGDVCGSDGVTYRSACEVPWCRNVRAVSLGACCVCPPEVAPVCGADGRTYANHCAAGCAGARVASVGACAGACPAVTCDLLCPDGRRQDSTGCDTCACRAGPACRTDADCSSARQQCIRGECTSALICPDTYEPVCAADASRYSNACVAAQAGHTAAEGRLTPCPTVTLLTRAACEGRCRATGPVCGEDNVTYANECALCGTGVALKTSGECRPIACQCPADFEPVCGSDGLSYGNGCLALCVGAQVGSTGVCPTASTCPSIQRCGLDCPSGFVVDSAGCRACMCRG